MWSLTLTLLQQGLLPSELSPKPSLDMLLCSGCHNKVPLIGTETTEINFLTVVKNERSRIKMPDFFPPVSSFSTVSSYGGSSGGEPEWDWEQKWKAGWERMYAVCFSSCKDIDIPSWPHITLIISQRPHLHMLSHISCNIRQVGLKIQILGNHKHSVHYILLWTLKFMFFLMCKIYSFYLYVPLPICPWYYQLLSLTSKLLVKCHRNQLGHGVWDISKQNSFLGTKL